MSGPSADTALQATLRVLTWNIDQFGSDRSAQQALIARCEPDVVMLQEVKGWYANRLRTTWSGPVVAGLDFHPESKLQWITSVLLLPRGTRVLQAGMMTRLPRPLRGVWADVTLTGLGDTHLVSWHNENAAADQPRKMAAFRGASAHLASARPPAILGADLNTWSDDPVLKEPNHEDPFYDEHAFVGPNPEHGLVDGWRALLDARNDLAGKREGPLAASYRLNSGPIHRFDRIFVSPGLRIVDGAYLFEDGVAAGSDHGLHWLDVTVNAAFRDRATVQTA